MPEEEEEEEEEGKKEVLRVKGICGFSTTKIYVTTMQEKRGLNYV